jgi:two-component system sensor histidine kinase PilS (NtrC family)
VADTPSTTPSPVLPVLNERYAIIRVYAYYRLILAALLLLLFFGQWVTNILGSSNVALFRHTLILYTMISAISLIRIHWRHYQPSDQHLFLIFFVDIVSISLLMHGSDGVSSGLGLLLVVTVSAASITLFGQLSTLIAALATLFILASTFYNMLQYSTRDLGSLLSAGLIGFLLFVTSQLFGYITRRMQIAAKEVELQTLRRMQTQQLNELIVQRMHTGIVVLAPNGSVRLMNESAAQLFNFQPSGDRKKKDEDISFFQVPALYECLQQWHRAPHSRIKPVKLKEAGPELQLSFSGLDKTPNSDVIVFVEDTRKIAQHAQQLKLASLGHLTANIAHEIRNPLGAISHAAQLLAESKTLDAHDHRLSEIIQNHSRRVNLIIDNVLQLSRRNKPIPTRIEMLPFLKKFINSYQQTHQGNLQITLECPDLPVYLNIDASQIEQALSNLCDNGLRYSLKATGKAHLLLRGFVDPLLGTPCLDVIDDGPGITKDNANNIFEPFFTTEAEGTGLGLYLARELCESNQARLDYIRTDDGKSCFQISFSHADKVPALL